MGAPLIVPPTTSQPSAPSQPMPDAVGVPRAGEKGTKKEGGWMAPAPVANSGNAGPSPSSAADGGLFCIAEFADNAHGAGEGDLSAFFDQQSTAIPNQRSTTAGADDFTNDLEALEPGQREIAVENRHRGRPDWYRTDGQANEIRVQIQMLDQKKRELNWRLNSCGVDKTDPRKLSRQLSLTSQAIVDLTFLLKINARAGSNVRRREEWEENHGFVDKLVTSYEQEEAYYAEKAKHRDWEVAPNWMLDITDAIVKSTPEVSGKLWQMFAGGLGTATEASLFPPGATVMHMGEGIAVLRKMHEGLRGVIQRTPSGPFKNWLENEVQLLGKRIEAASVKLDQGTLTAQEFMETVEAMKNSLAEASRRQRSTSGPQLNETPPAPSPPPSAAPPQAPSVTPPQVDYRLNGPVRQSGPTPVGPLLALGPWPVPARPRGSLVPEGNGRSSPLSPAGVVAGAGVDSPTQESGRPQRAPETSIHAAGRDGGKTPNDAASAPARGENLATQAANLSAAIDRSIADLRSDLSLETISKLRGVIESARGLLKPIQADYQKLYKQNFDQQRHRYKGDAPVAAKLADLQSRRDELKSAIATGERAVEMADAKLQVRTTYNSRADVLREPTQENLTKLKAETERAVDSWTRVERARRKLYLQIYHRGVIASPDEQKQLDDLQLQLDELKKIIALAKETVRISSP
jgi:hypothetical protein